VHTDTSMCEDDVTAAPTATIGTVAQGTAGNLRYISGILTTMMVLQQSQSQDQPLQTSQVKPTKMHLIQLK